MPTTIGSQTNVPAPGDPITSPWHQDTAKKIVHVFASIAARDAWAAPPNGAVCQAPAGTWYNRISGAWVRMAARRDDGWARAAPANYAASGLYDLITPLANGTTFDHPVRVYVQANASWGYGGVPTQAAFDIWRFVDNTVSPTSPPNYWAQTAMWESSSWSWGWAVAAGQQAGFKIRANAITVPLYMGVDVLWWVQHD